MPSNTREEVEQLKQLIKEEPIRNLRDSFEKYDLKSLSKKDIKSIFMEFYTRFQENPIDAKSIHARQIISIFCKLGVPDAYKARREARQKVSVSYHQFFGTFEIKEREKITKYLTRLFYLAIETGLSRNEIQKLVEEKKKQMKGLKSDEETLLLIANELRAEVKSPPEEDLTDSALIKIESTFERPKVPYECKIEKWRGEMKVACCFKDILPMEKIGRYTTQRRRELREKGRLYSESGEFPTEFKEGIAEMWEDYKYDTSVWIEKNVELFLPEIHAEIAFPDRFLETPFNGSYGEEGNYRHFVTAFSYVPSEELFALLDDDRVLVSDVDQNTEGSELFLGYKYVKKKYKLDDPELHKLLKKEIHSKIKSVIEGTIFAKVEKVGSIYRIIELYQ